VEDKVKIVQVVYTDNDPIKTQKVLEAVNGLSNLQPRTAGTAFKKGLKFINEQIPAVSKLVDQTERKLEQFRKTIIIDPEQQATAIAQTLNGIEQERQATRVKSYSG